MSDKITTTFCALRPAGGFCVVLADPPWSFDNYSAAGEAKNAKSHYECMTADAIAALPVSLLTADDCALFLWATWPTMPLWLPTIDAWGFHYAGLAWEWIKFNPATGKYAFGPGYGTRKNLEPCLLATRGAPTLRKPLAFFGVEGERSESHSVRDFVEAMPMDALRAPRREHSRKPDEQYSRIQTMFDGPYVELFARQHRAGWSAWGNQTESFAA